ncbi:MAG: thioredoxin reductase [Gaiellaceae bacterium]|jgi:thioredoxin reductase (NADPH)|nr:thioredoxin reductase [Gaiellaceae bacterium]
MAEFDLVVAGGGIAGLTAGLTSARLGRSTLVLTGGTPGGLLLSINEIEGVPAFPDGVAGYDLCPLAEEQAATAGAAFRPDELEALEPGEAAWSVHTTNGSVTAGAVVLATGARLRELDVPGEERLRGKGVSHCASCDAPLLRDRVVAVVGGGDSALQEALTLADAAAQVVVLHRGKELEAQETYRRRVLAHGRIDVRYGVTVDEVLGTDTVSGVRTRERATDAVADLEVAALFVYVGLQPSTAFAAGGLSRDADGRIVTDAALNTALPGVFAAGICRAGAAGRAAASAGDGATAVTSAHRYLGETHG